MEDSNFKEFELISQGINFVERGTLAIGIQTPSLKTANCVIVGQGDWFGNYMEQGSSLSPFMFVEIEPCSIIHFSNRQIAAIAEKNVEIYKWFYSLSFESRDKWLQSQLINNENMNVRIVFQLLEILAHINSKKLPLEISISQQQLSDMTGIARQRVNEVMKWLEREGLVELWRNKISVKSVSKLAEYLDDVDLSIRDPREFL